MDFFPFFLFFIRVSQRTANQTQQREHVHDDDRKSAREGEREIDGREKHQELGGGWTTELRRIIMLDEMGAEADDARGKRVNANACWRLECLPSTAVTFSKTIQQQNSSLLCVVRR